MQNEILDVLLELGLTPVDWVDASVFSKLTGIEEQKLTHRRKNWPQDLVWTKQDGNIYYSLRGYNQWLTEQTKKRYHLVSELEMAPSKSISALKTTLFHHAPHPPTAEGIRTAAKIKSDLKPKLNGEF